MHLLKPTWVHHDGDKAIFSVDIHPDGTRFATGGQGQDSSGRVVIWNLQPVVSEKAEENNKVPKILCQLDQHLGCVNCVRWSHSGRFLASAGDDKAIIIWQRSNYGGGAVFGTSVINVESWRIVNTLRGHDGDILDIAWSPNDVWLASASIDNTVIVWNAAKWPEQVRVLKGHTGMVKGVTWDPVGRYLASQADDKSMRIWRTSNWTIEQKVTDPFAECGGTTTVLRPSWSPDGQYLVSAHAMNNGGPTAQIIERDNWGTDKDFVGHRKAITCVRFNPNLLGKQAPGVARPVQYCCVAIGSRDRSISIWFTSLKRPLVIIHDVFEESVLDIAWSKCGRYLMAVSQDGSLAFINFSAEEIGKPFSEDEMIAVHVKLYGNSALGSVTNNCIIENPDFLDVKPRDNSSSKCHIENGLEEKRILPPTAPTNKQIEMMTADGRRRITPMFIPPPAGGDTCPTQMEASFSTSRTEKSKIIVEKVDGIVEPNVTSPTKSQSSQHGGSTTAPNPNSMSLADLESVPAGLSSRIEGHGSAPASPERVTIKHACSEALPIPVKRKRGRARLVPNVVQPVLSTAATPASVHTSTPLSQVPQIQAKHTLPAANIPRLYTVQVPGTLSSDNVAHTICIENDWKSNGVVTKPNGPLHRVRRYNEHKDPTWTLFFPAAVRATQISHTCAVFACKDSTLRIINPTDGECILPPLQLPGRPSQLFLQGHNIVSLTTDAILSVWNYRDKKRVMQESVQHVVCDRGDVQAIKLTGTDDKLIPILILKCGDTFSWDVGLKCWIQLGESVQIRQYVSPEYTVVKPAHANSGHGVLTEILMHSATYSGAGRVSQSVNQSQEVRLATTESFLKRTLTSAQYLGSATDYVCWLKKLAKFYTDESMEKKLKLLFDELLPSTASRTALLGLDRRQLLEECLQELLHSKNSINFQRLHAEFKQQMDEVMEESI